MAAAPKPKEDWETILAAKVRRLLSEGKDRGKDSLRILVTGRTGAGKSALVNSIVGEYVAEEGYYQYGETTEVTKYEKKVGDIVVTIYDSPGLQDGIKDKHVEEEYLKDLERNCREVDLNLFCVRMNDMIRSNEIDAIKKLSNAFGRDKFWQNTLIVLTFANEVKPPKPRFSHDIVTPVTYFSQRLGQWKIDLQFTLTDMAGISKKVVENVPIVPAGYSDQPSLPAANCDYWLSNLWFQCLNRTKDIAKPILLNINWKRLRPGDHIKEEDIPKKKGYKQPIVTKHQTIESYLSEFSIRDKSTKTTGSGLSTASTGFSPLVPVEQATKPGIDDKPSLAKLQLLRSGSKQISITKTMASKWLMLADLLEFDTVTMTYLTESMKRYNDEWNCYRIFRYWIRGYGGQPCTWRKLIELLEDCDEEELTEDVKNALS